MEFNTISLNEYVKGSGASDRINYIADDMTKIAFLTELDSIRVIYQHFLKTEDGKNVGLPCPGMDFRDQCPGCQSDNDKERKTTPRIIAYTKNLTTGYDNYLMLPISLKEGIERQFNRDGSLRSRPYIIWRTKEGQSTKYEIEREDKYDEQDIPDPGEIPSFDDVIQGAWDYGIAALNGTLDDEAEEKKEEEEKKLPPSQRGKSESKPEPKEEKADDFPRSSGLSIEELEGMSYLKLVKMAEELEIAFDENSTRHELAVLIHKNQ